MTLLKWAIIAFIISLVAGALGFTGAAGKARTASYWLFGIFLAVAILFGVLMGLGVKLAA